jgi:hypothetical protein
VRTGGAQSSSHGERANLHKRKARGACPPLIAQPSSSSFSRAASTDSEGTSSEHASRRGTRVRHSAMSLLDPDYACAADLTMTESSWRAKDPFLPEAPRAAQSSRVFMRFLIGAATMMINIINCESCTALMRWGVRVRA